MSDSVMSITGNDVTAMKPEAMAFTPSVVDKDIHGNSWEFVNGKDYPDLAAEIRSYNKMPTFNATQRSARKDVYRRIVQRAIQIDESKKSKNKDFFKPVNKSRGKEEQKKERSERKLGGEQEKMDLGEEVKQKEVRSKNLDQQIDIFFQNMTKDSEGLLKESLEASIANAKILVNEVQVKGKEPYQAFLEIKKKQEKYNTANKKPIASGLNILTVLQSIIAKPPQAAKKEIEGLQRIANVLGLEQLKATTDIKDQLIADQSEALSMVASEVVGNSMYFPIILKIPGEDLMTKYNASTSTELKNKMKEQYGQNVAETTIPAIERDPYSAYQCNLIGPQQCKAFTTTVLDFWDTQWKNNIANITPMGMNLRANNYREFDWRKQQWCQGKMYMHNVSRFGYDNQNDITGYGKQTVDGFIEEMIRPFKDDHTDLADLTAGQGSAQNLSQIVHSLMFRKYESKFSNEIHTRYDKSLFRTSKQEIKTTIADTSNERKQIEWLTELTNTYSVYVGAMTMFGQCLQSQQYITKYILQYIRGYEPVILSTGLRVTNTDFDWMYVLVFKRLETEKTRSFVRVLMYGGTYTFKVKELDLDDQVFCIGFSKSTIQKATNWRSVNPIEDKYVPDEYGLALKNHNNGVFYQNWGLCMFDFGKSCSTQVKFSGLFKYTDGVGYGDSMGGKPKSYQPGVKTYKLRMGDYRSTNLVAQIGHISTQDSSMIITPDMALIEDYDEDIEGVLFKDPEVIRKDPMSMIAQLRSVASSTASATVKLNKLANVLNYIRQNGASERFYQEVGNIMKEGGLSDLADPKNEYKRNALARGGLELKWLNSEADKFGILPFLNDDGGLLNVVQKKVQTGLNFGSAPYKSITGYKRQRFNY